MSENLAKEIDDYAKVIFNIPNWILKRRFLMKLYAKFYKLNIECQRNNETSEFLRTDYRFFKRDKKVGELKIKDIDLM